jgi:uncharacterized YccA/Bax inhibitor family protein
MLGFLVEFLVALIVFGLIYWIAGMIPLPEPFKRIVMVVLVVIFCIWLIYFLLGLFGGAGLSFPSPGPVFRR